MFSSEQEKPVKYGELIVLGCNGSLPGGDRGRRRSRFSLFKRPTANGVKPSTIHTCSTQAAKVISNNSQHSVSYTLSWAETVVVEYTDDNETDMFQIGRSIESPIDFVVTNTVGGGPGNGPVRPQQSTISRFACRIVCDRTPPYTARLFAAGFDCSRNIFLGEKAAKWHTFGGQMDGLTTNGVLLMQPACRSKPAVWREISVCGNVFTLRDSTSPQTRGNQVKDECPVLLDSSLIDLCGVTLLWRSVEGLSRSPTAGHLEALRLRLNAARPQCPVLLSTLAFPSLDGPRPRRPWAYLACGHVHGFHQWQGRGMAYKQYSSAETDKKETERDGDRDQGERERDMEGKEEGVDNEEEAITEEREEKRDKREKVKREETKEGGRDSGEREKERRMEEINNGGLAIQGEIEGKRETVKREGGRSRQERERDTEKERQVERIEEAMEAIKGERECPLCRSRGPYVPLTLGRVSGAYVDAEPPSHAFIPCGHVCSARTAEHWSKAHLKRGANTFHPACPFCLGQLKRDRPYIKLIFQGPLD